MIRHSQRRLLLMTAVFALSLLSCGREVTGPGNGLNYGRARTASLALDPHMPSLFSQLVGASDVVPFERVRIVLLRDDATVALDTIVTFPSDADSLALTLTLPLPLNTPDDGLPLALSMAYINAQGDTVFRAGPSNILALPVGSTGSSQPISLPVRYDGVGAGAASVVIAPESLVVVAGTASVFTAEAFDDQRTPIPNTPLLFFTLDSTRALVAEPGVGAVTWLPVRGTARIVAALPDGARADTAFVTVELPASQLVLESGNAQAGPIGAALPQPIVARVLAADGVPVAGVEVVFAVTAGGGSLSVLTDTSDANGAVETLWTLGTLLGSQSVTATAAGLTGSPLTFTATAGPSDPAQLAILAQPTAGTAGTALAPALVVAVQDIEGNTVTSYTGAVTVAFAAPQDAVLGGTTTVNAVAGLATFADLTIDLAGSYTLVVSSDTLPVLAAEPVVIAAAEAVLPDILVQPTGGVAGVVLPAFSAVALDQFGNIASGFVGVVTITAERAGSPANVIVAGDLVTAIDGVATFDAVRIDSAGTYALVIDFGSIGTYVTEEFTVAPAAASTIALLDGDAQSGVVATTLPAPLRVRVTDDFGNGVSGVGVTWSVTAGVAQLTDTIVVTDANGIAATAVILGGTTGALEIAATAAGLQGSPVGFTATVEAGAPALVELVSGGAQSVAAGEPLAAPIVVRVVDALGNPVSGVTVTWEARDGASAFAAPTAVTDAAGLATTTATAAFTAGERFIGAAAAGVLAPLDIEVLITAAAASAFEFTATAADGVAGVVLAPFAVRALDQFGNALSAFADSVVIAVDSGPVGAVLGGTTRQLAVAGTATFANLTLTTAGTYRLRAEWPGITSALSGAFVVQFGAFTTLALVDGNLQSGPVAATLPLPLSVRATDDFGNAIPGVTVLWASLSGGAQPVDTVVVTDATGLAATTVLLGTAAGPAQVGASAPPVIEVPVVFDLTATAGAAAQLAMTTEPTATTVAGATIAPIVVAARDAQGNIAAGFTGTVSVQIATGAVGATLGGTLDAVAVAGLATFDQLVIETVGAYTLRFTSPGLADTVSAAFDILPAAAFAMQVQDGDAQTGTVGTALANPLRVAVVDAFGNAVPGLPVGWTITTVGGALSADTTVTGADGIAGVNLTLPTTVGAAAVDASVLGLSGSPVGFTATALAGPAAALVVTSSPDTVAAGSIAAPIVVEARDAFGNTATTFADNVTLTASVAPGTFAAGTPTRAAIAGVATFDDLVLNATGGWLIDVASGSLLTSVNLTVIEGPPASFTIVAGNAQVGIASSLLPQPLTTRVTDAVGNAVSGATVVFTVTAGGGTLTGGGIVDSVITNSAGDAVTGWTLGADTLAAQTVQATFGAFPALDFTATAAPNIANRTWTGGVSTLWSDAANWAELTVPIATDSVRIPAGATFMPELAGATLVSRFTLEDGATLNLQSQLLSVSGNLTVPTALAILNVGEGSIEVIGPAEVRGALPRLSVTSGNVTLGSQVDVSGNVFIVDGGDLAIGAQTLLVAGLLQTESGGTLTMTGPGTVAVDGDASFLGGSTAGRLTAGQLLVRGNFTAGGLTPTAFAASAGHTVVLDGALYQTVAFSAPDTALSATCTASCFGALEVPKLVGQGGVGFTSSVKSLAAMRFAGDSVSALGRALISTGAPEFLVGSTIAARIGWQDNYLFSGTFTVDTLVAWGVGSALPISESIPTIVAGSHRIVGAFNTGLVVEGSLTVDATATSITGSLITRGAGALVMQDPANRLTVIGDATFGGAGGAGLLTAGELAVGGNFTVTGAGGSYASDAAHTLRMNGLLPGTTVSVADPANNPIGNFVVSDAAAVNFSATGAIILGNAILDGTTATATVANEVVIVGSLIDSVGGRWSGGTTRFLSDNPILPVAIGGTVVFAGSVTLTDSLNVGAELRINQPTGVLDLNGHRVRAGEFQTSEGGRLVMDAAADSLLIAGAVNFSGGVSTLTAGYLEIGGSLFQGTTTDALQAGPAHETRLVGATPATLGFANPGFGATESHLGRLVIAKSTVQANIDLGLDVFVNGVFEVLPLQFYTLTSGNSRIVSRGASLSDMTFVNTRWELLDGEPVAPIANVTFDQMNVTATQLRIARGGGTVQLQQPTFLTVPVGGLLLLADDTVADADNLTVAVTLPTPEFAGADIQALNGAVITGWAANAVLNWGGFNIGGSWTDPGNWLQGIVPGSADSVVIGNADYAPVISTPVTVRSLVSAIANPLTVNAALTVTDWLTVTSVSAPITCGVGGELVLAATDSVVFNGAAACGMRVTAGRAAARGTSSVDSIVVENSAQLDIRSDTVNVLGNFRTTGLGTLRMENPLGSLQIFGEARFEGGSTDALLTDGTVTLYGNFVQAITPSAYLASGGHFTRFFGTGTQSVSFANPDAGPAGSRFAQMTIAQDGGGTAVSLNSDVFAQGQLFTGGGSRNFSSALPIAPLLQTGGATAGAVNFANVRWGIVGTADLVSIGDITFSAMATGGAPQMSVARGTGTATISNATYDAAGTGDFLSVSDPSGPGDGAFAVTMVNPSPAFHGGRIQTDGTASILNWNAEPSFTWTGAVSSAWREPGNWDSGVVPDSTSAVVIPGGIVLVPVIVADSIMVGSMTMNAGASLSLTLTPFIVSGSFLADPSATIAADVDSPISLFGGGTVRGNFPSIFFAGDYTVAGPFATSADLGVVAGNLDLVGTSITVGGVLSTSGTGTLTMNNAETVTVGGLAFFGGGSTSGRLTSGRLILQGDFVQSGDVASFDATGAHVTEFAPALAASPVVTFFNPASSGFANIEIANGRVELGTPTVVRGSLTLADGVELDGPGSISVAGDINGGGSSAELFVPRVAFGGAFNYLGIYDADTTEFIGTGQVIPTQPNAQQTTWRHVIVSGTTTFSGAALSIAGLGSVTIAPGGELAILSGGSIDLFTAPITADFGGTLRVATGGAFRSRAHSDIEGALVIESGASAFFNSGGLDGQHLFPAGSDVSGAGTFDVNGANLVQVAGAFDVGTLQLLNATLAFNGADTAFVGGGAYAGGGFLNGTGVLAIRGAFSSTFGNPDGTGTIAVLSGGTLTWRSPLRGWTLDVSGTVIWGDWNLSFEQDTASQQYGSMIVRDGGVFELNHGTTTPRELFGLGSAAPPNNVIQVLTGGTIRKSSGTGISNIRPRVETAGLFDIQSGTINVQGTCTNTGSATGAGSLTGNCGAYP